MFCKGLGLLALLLCLEGISAEPRKGSKRKVCDGGTCKNSVGLSIAQTSARFSRAGAHIYADEASGDDNKLETHGHHSEHAGRQVRDNVTLRSKIDGASSIFVEDVDRMEQRILNIIGSTKPSKVPNALARPQLAGFAKIFLEQIFSMEGNINTTRDAAVKILQSHEKAFQFCESKKSSGYIEVEILKVDRAGKSATHKSCRNLEKKAKNDDDACVSTLSVLKSAKETSCDVYSNTAATKPSCDLLPTNVNNYQAWLEAHKAFVTKALVQLGEAKAACDTSTAASEKKTAQCEGPGSFQKNHSDQRAKCDHDQSALETATCSYATKYMAVCEEHSNCFEVARIPWDSDKPELQAQEASFKHEWWMLQRMRCFLAVLQKAGGSTVDSHLLNLCTNQTHHTDFLNLPWFNESETPGQCTEPTKPCSTKYVSDEYSSLPAEAPVAQCNACSVPMPYFLGEDAFVQEDSIFKACPDGSVPAPIYDKDSRLAIEAFIALLDMPSWSMFIGNWFMGPNTARRGCTSPDNKLGYLKVSSSTGPTWTEMDDPDYQVKIQQTWSGNANCVDPIDADGKSNDPPVMYVADDKSVDLGNCRYDGCGYSKQAQFTKSGRFSGKCFNNRNEGCRSKVPVICTRATAVN